MKKLYTLLFFSVALSLNAQVINGDLESWTSGFPTSFSPDPYTVGVSRETVIVHSGSSSAKHTTPTLPASPTSVKIQNETAVVVPGTTYRISYYFLDNTDDAKSRPWIYWLDGSGATLPDNATDFRPSTYSTNSPNWQLYNVEVKAPANAAKLRFEMRTYADGTVGGGSIYYDDMVVSSNLSVKQNTISGLNVYPNPVTNGNLFITSDKNDTKSIAIFDVLGKQVLSANNVTTQPVNVASLSKGVYFLKITEAGQTASRKLVIK